jgi:hypothetical protein
LLSLSASVLPASVADFSQSRICSLTTIFVLLTCQREWVLNAVLAKRLKKIQRSTLIV